jgi:periplasmic divalent cation tolerance protein
MKNDFIAVFVMCSSRKEADIIAGALLKKRLVACANIAGSITSRFWWKGKIDTASEVLVILKTRRANFHSVERDVKRLHSYDVPEIIALPIAAGSAAYLDWIRDSVV